MCLRSKGLKLSVFKPFSFTSTLFPRKGNIEKHFIFLFQLLFKADSPTFPLRSSKMRDILKISSLRCFKMFSSLAGYVFLWARSSAGRAPRSHPYGRTSTNDDWPTISGKNSSEIRKTQNFKTPLFVLKNGQKAVIWARSSAGRAFGSHPKGFAGSIPVGSTRVKNHRQFGGDFSFDHNNTTDGF